MVVGYEGRRLSRMKDAALNDDSRCRMSQERVSPSPPGRHTGLAHPHSLGAVGARGGDRREIRKPAGCAWQCTLCVLRLYPPYHVCFQTGRKPHRKPHRCARCFSMQVRVSWDAYVPSQCPPPCVKAPHRGKRGVCLGRKQPISLKNKTYIRRSELRIRLLLLLPLSTVACPLLSSHPPHTLRTIHHV